MTSDEKIFGYLGLAERAGKMASGEFMVETAVKKGKARVVLVAGDASENTKKQFRNMCEYYDVPCYEIADKARLGKAIGKEFRASCAVTDDGLAKAVLKVMRQEI